MPFFHVGLFYKFVCLKGKVNNVYAKDQDNTLKIEEFKERIQNQSTTLPSHFDKTREERIKRNKEVLKWAIEVIILCGKQCLLLRGHREKSDESNHSNPGNFLAILRLLSETNETLKEHLNCPIARNATDLPPAIKNELIDIIAYEVLQKDLIEEIKAAKFILILADEVESHHVEQLPL